ncbi:type II secretion system F family protein [Candidatus Pacearchaeota archaeon]|nr:type II secretion system F family protein [Candidatus Pacearchaeota archaeon]
MELRKIHYVGMVLGLLIIGLSFLIYGREGFFFVIGLGIIIGISPFMFTFIGEARINQQKEEMFLEFARNLVESVKTGTPISKSIVNMRDKPYGVLSVHVRKLANQISLGIPLNEALKVFARDVESKSISRVLTLIGQAERAGGDIGEILENVAGAVSMSDKLKKERKSAISSLVVQGYIIFFVFMIIILIMQFKIIPMLSGIAEVSEIGIAGIQAGSSTGAEEISSSFLYLLVIQGFFSGLVIGKLAEGSVKAGIKHSFSLVLLSFMISAIAGFLFG